MKGLMYDGYEWCGGYDGSVWFDGVYGIVFDVEIWFWRICGSDEFRSLVVFVVYDVMGGVIVWIDC